MSNNKKKEVVIGIDLGTTNCCVAYSDGSSIRVFENSEGFRTTPSVLAYQNGKFVVGRSAKREIGINPDVVSSIKRLMGTRKTVNIGGRELSPEQVSAEFIRNQVEVASEKLDEKIKKLVITVPAYFDDVQRQATKDAAKIAGFEAIRIISEPTAAALAYGLEKEAKQKNIVENVMVYDLGGGTFDCSIITIDIGEQDESGMIQVKSTAGINDLGGDDYDFKIFEFVSKEIKRETRNIVDENSKFSNDEGIKKAYYRILEASQEAKHTLSSSLEAYINLPFLFEKESLQYTITRSQFENLTENLTKKTIVRANDALKEANLKIDQIDKILLVGGSTRMPIISEEIEKEFGKKPSKNLNPDEVVAIGAAIQGSVLAGNENSILLMDVTPLSLGIVTEGNINTTLIAKNSSIPTKKVEMFSTAADNQTNIEIRIVQGERPNAFDNRMLGTFMLEGIKPAQRGIPQIQVTLSINANGILEVSAEELGSSGSENKKASIKISNSENLNQEEIEKMKKDAEDNKEKDNELRENIEVLNRAQGYVHMFDKQQKEMESAPNFNDRSEEYIRFKEIYDPFKESVNAKDYPKIKEELKKLEKIFKAAEELKNQQEESNERNSSSNDLNDEGSSNFEDKTEDKDSGESDEIN